MHVKQVQNGNSNQLGVISVPIIPHLVPMETGTQDTTGLVPITAVGQEHAANIPLTSEDVAEFQSLWLEVTGEAIDLKTAAEYGRQLLVLYKFTYKPISQELFEQLLADKTAEENKHE